MMFQELIDQGLVKQKRYDNGLSVFKYSREVFYRALWNTNPLLLEARGMVLDDDGTKVIWPFTKVFNHHENGTELDLDTRVIAPRKVNGFMAAARYWKGELIVSTTGTLDSDFAKLARSYIEKLEGIEIMAANITVLFEICDNSDPHIVAEEEGAYLIGGRYMQNTMYEGEMLTEGQLDVWANLIGAKRPAVVMGTFRDVLLLLQDCKHEGYMVRLMDAKQETVMKLKSPHYLTKKFLMRMGQKKVTAMFEDKEEFLKTIDEEFYRVVHHITRWFDAERWAGYSDRVRRTVIEEYFENLRGD
jgi:tRNA splicing ligase